MTAMLGCDGCGDIIQDRGKDEARTWMELSFAPIVGGGILPNFDFDFIMDDEEDDEEEPEDVEPSRHFCSIKCLRQWAVSAEIETYKEKE